MSGRNGFWGIVDGRRNVKDPDMNHVISKLREMKARVEAEWCTEEASITYVLHAHTIFNLIDMEGYRIYISVHISFSGWLTSSPRHV